MNAVNLLILLVVAAVSKETLELRDSGEMLGVQITMQGEGQTLYLTSAEKLGSANCGGSCNFVFTYHTQEGGTLWNIIPFEYEGDTCVAIQKANGYQSNQYLLGNKKMWSYPAKSWAYEGVATFNSEAKKDGCWELVPTDVQNKYKIVMKKGGRAGKSMSAPSVTFNSPYVEKTRRFVLLDDTDVNNIWDIISTP